MVFPAAPRIAPALIAIAALVSGCTAGSRHGYPSLAPRPEEKKGFGEPDAPAPAIAAPDPALDAKLAAARAALIKVRAGFDTAAASAARTSSAARGAAIGSEPWIAAQTDLAELDGLRAQTHDVVTTLEDLAIARAADLLPAYPPLEEARGAAATESARQTARIDALQAGLPRA